jgi:phosphoribosylamine--glycine ligase
MMRLRSDLAAACLAMLEGRGDKVELDWDSRKALGVVVASGGYPAGYAKGKIISGLETGITSDTYVFHAGTSLDDDGRIVTTGGRVLCVVGLGDTVGEAQARAYARAGDIAFDGAFCRRDIGYRAIARE